MPDINTWRIVRVVVLGRHQMKIAVTDIAEFGVGVDIARAGESGIDIAIFNCRITENRKYLAVFRRYIPPANRIIHNGVRVMESDTSSLLTRFIINYSVIDKSYSIVFTTYAGAVSAITA